MKIEIDPSAGFCAGVVKAINIAEDALKNNETLYCLGEIVHNTSEVNRLENNGLITIDDNEFLSLKNSVILFRAHGEPPDKYQKAYENGNTIIDATCKVVLMLQKKIKTAFEEAKNDNSQIVIFGKPSHPEVIALSGQTNNEAIVITTFDDINKLDFSRPIKIFSQTTMETEDYIKIQNLIKNKYIERNGEYESYLEINNTICGQVSNRKPKLKAFCNEFDIIIFVSDTKSSNGTILFKYCRQINTRTYFITKLEELKNINFDNCKSVGITGATSTPLWLMREVKEKIKILTNNKK